MVRLFLQKWGMAIKRLGTLALDLKNLFNIYAEIQEKCFCEIWVRLFFHQETLQLKVTFISWYFEFPTRKYIISICAMHIFVNR